MQHYPTGIQTSVASQEKIADELKLIRKLLECLVAIQETKSKQAKCINKMEGHLNED